MRKKEFFKLILSCIITAPLLMTAVGCNNQTLKLDNDVELYIPTNVEKIKREKEFPANANNSLLKISLAKNEYEGGQLIVRSDIKELINPSLTISSLKNDKGNIISSENIQIYQQHYINVDQTTSADLEKGWYPDALIPLQEEFVVEKGENQGYWITVKTDENQAPGIYKGFINLKYDSGEITVPIEVEVWDFAIPTESSFPSAFAIWMNQVGEYSNLSGDEYWKVAEDYYWFQTQYRLAPDDLPFAYSTIDEFVEKAAKYVNDPKVASYRIPFFLEQIEGYNYNLMKEKNKELIDKLRAANLLEKGYYYIATVDEPTYEMYGLVKEICDVVNEIAPDVRNVVTKQPVKELEGYVDTWCPVYGMFNEAVAKREQALGNHVWWYGCISPKYPYPTYHIDDRLMSARLVSWMQKDYNVEGHLYWSTTITKKYNAEIGVYEYRDIFKDPFAFPGAAGDGYLIYPGTVNDGIINKNAPIPTIRLEAARDGAEDYEYLIILEKKIEEKIKSLGLENTISVGEIMDGFYSQLYLSMNNFETDPQKLLDMRSIIANAIVNFDKENVLMTAQTPAGKENKQKRIVKLYTSSDLSLSLIADNETVLITPEKAGENTNVYIKEFELGEGRHNLEIINSIDGKDYSFTRILFIPYIEKGLQEEVFFDFETEVVAGKLNKFYSGDALNGLEISSDYATSGNKSLKVTFNSNVDWTEMNIFTSDFENVITDWSEYKYLEFDVTNPIEETRERELYIAIKTELGYDDSGRSSFINVGSTLTVRIPLNIYGRIADSMDNINHIKIGSWGSYYRGEKDSFVLYFDDFKLLKEEANG